MNILGINAYHANASACLIRDGELIAAVEEERLCRVKYWSGFPAMAIRHCLAAGGIDVRDLDHVGISRDPRANLYHKAMFLLRQRPRFELVQARLGHRRRVRDWKAELCEQLQVRAGELRAELHHVEHHHAHLASAFFVSPFPDAAVLSIDGAGDFVTTMSAVGRGRRLELLDSIRFPHSLGIFYSALCQWLGFPGYGDEGKVMGLAAYGEPRHLARLRRLVRVQADGTFELDLDHFVHHVVGVETTSASGRPLLSPLFSPRLVAELGPPRAPDAALTQDTADWSASLQAMLEEAVLALVHRLHRQTGMSRLCLAGGVAFNSVLNGRISRATPFRELFVQPNAGDGGTALGVAYHIHHELLGHPRCYVMQHAALGPRFTNEAVAEALARNALAARWHADSDLCRVVARLLATGAIVGWFQGGMEWGPRALGNRSILADPRRADMKDVLNGRIKQRERFRPFAPAVLAERTGEFFVQSASEPFMSKVYEVRAQQRERIPAATHVDGTGRLQTVDQGAAPLFAELLREFDAITGVPVLINTSFNENEPIVCTPDQALACFARTRMDALAIGNYLVCKA
ncbi:MAG: carbamoyltransferase C-terminal domain-containing protein [Planctomycetota bacterium]